MTNGVSDFKAFTDMSSEERDYAIYEEIRSLNAKLKTKVDTDRFNQFRTKLIAVIAFVAGLTGSQPWILKWVGI